MVDEQGNCRKFLKHKDCKRLPRGKPCPFKHTGREQMGDALSSEQHSAFLSYAEAKGKDPCDVSWSTVATNGEGKWIAAGKKLMRAAEGNQGPRMYPVLEGRKKMSRLDREGRASYSEVAAATEGSE